MKLKKISLWIVVLVVHFLFVPTLVFATMNSDSFKKTYISGYSYVDASGHYGNFEHFTRNGDDYIAYCIEPGVSLSSGRYNGIYNVSLEEKANHVHLSEAQMEAVSFVSHFGWGYNGHTGDEWIVATQALIWQKLGHSFQFTSQNNPTDPWKYVIETPSVIQEKMNEIERLIATNLETPLFQSNHAQIPVDTTYDFVDTKNRLQDFEVATCRNCFFSKNKNKLSISPISKEEGYVILAKRSEVWPADYIVYQSDAGQNLIVPGKVQLVNMQLSFEVVSGSFALKKYDFENMACKPQEGASLVGSVYHLFKEDGTFISELSIDENCSASVSDLKLGRYFIKEVVPGKNYSLDSASYFFEVKEKYMNQKLTVYSRLASLGQVKLEKFDNKTNSCEASSPYASLVGAIYGLYKEDGTLMEKLKIGEDCSALSKKNLPLGNYYLQEIKAPKGYKLDLEKHYFSVTTQNVSNLISVVLTEEVYDAKVKLYKNYSSFDQLLKEENAIFEILSKKDNKVIATLTTNEEGYAEITLLYGDYILRQVAGKEGYHFTEDIEFSIDEKSKDVLEFSIVNKPFQGSLVFTKVDAATGQFLQDAYIEIYDEHDNLVFQGKTDSNGTIVIDALSYGKYSLKEIEAPKGYALSMDTLFFEIKEDGEQVSLELQNEQEVIVPSTGVFKIPSVVFVSLFNVTLGIGFIYYEKKKKI